MECAKSEKAALSQLESPNSIQYVRSHFAQAISAHARVYLDSLQQIPTMKTML